MLPGMCQMFQQAQNHLFYHDDGQVFWYENIVSRTCSYAWYVLTRRLDSNYPDVQRKVLQSTRVRSAIEQAAKHEYEQRHMSMSNQNQRLMVNDDQIDLKPNLIESKLVEKYRSYAIDQLIRLQSCISSSLLRIAAWILYRLLSKIFTSIQFNKAQIERIRKASRLVNGKTVPILYLPLHRSHLDYILVSFILFMNNISPPLVAAGENLMIPFFGNLLRGLGAFFIKRSNRDGTNPANDKRATIYNAVLQSYILENLREGNSLEFFLEGGRSRSGKPLMPKMGLLSFVVDAVLEGSVFDVCVVPVSISYEKSVDGSFVNEKLGLKKQPETFGSALRSIWKILHSSHGLARVDFNKPFMLKDYLKQVSAQERIKSLETISMGLDGARPVKPRNQATRIVQYCVACALPMNRKKTDLDSRNDELGSDLSFLMKTEVVRRQTIESLARHVLHDAYQDAALMPTHLVASLLLNTHRDGTTIDQLATDLDWLSKMVCREKGRNLSMLGDSRAMIHEALFYLGKDVIATEKIKLKWSSWNRLPQQSINGTRHHQKNHSNGIHHQYSNSGSLKYGGDNGGFSINHHHHNQDFYDDEDDGYDGSMNHQQQQRNHSYNDPKSQLEITYLKPGADQCSLIHLHYYVNQCTTLFQLESVMAVALFSFFNGQISSLNYDRSTFASNLAIDKQEFTERCRTICLTLQYEFVFSKNCQSLDHVIKEMISRFHRLDIFVRDPRKPAALTLPANSSPSCVQQAGSINSPKRRQSRFKFEGSLQDECILEVDEDRCTSDFDDSEDTEDDDVDDGQDHHGGQEDDQVDNNNNNDNSTGGRETRKCFHIRLTETNKRLLMFYHSLLKPYMQAYWVTANKLATMITINSNTADQKTNPSDSSSLFTDHIGSVAMLPIMESDVILKRLINYSQQMAQSGSILYESISNQTFENALKYLESTMVIQQVRQNESIRVESPSNSDPKLHQSNHNHYLQRQQQALIKHHHDLSQSSSLNHHSHNMNHRIPNPEKLVSCNLKDSLKSMFPAFLVSPSSSSATSCASARSIVTSSSSKTIDSKLSQKSIVYGDHHRLQQISESLKIFCSIR